MSRNAFAKCEQEYNEREEQRETTRAERAPSARNLLLLTKVLEQYIHAGDVPAALTTIGMAGKELNRLTEELMK